MGAGQSVQSEHSKKEIKTLKIVLLGDERVGKSSILRRLTRHNFLDNYEPTEAVNVEPITRKIRIGADKNPSGKTNQSGYEIVSLQVWDFPSQAEDDENPLPRERFLADADGVIVVADLTRESSVNLGDTYKHHVDRIVGKPIPSILLGTKLDLIRAEEEDSRAIQQVAQTAASTGVTESWSTKRPTTTVQTQRLLEEWKKFNLGGASEVVAKGEEQLSDPDLISIKTAFSDEWHGEEEEVDAKDHLSVTALKETSARGNFTKCAALSVKTDTQKLLQNFDELVKIIYWNKVEDQKFALESSSKGKLIPSYPFQLPSALKTSMTGIPETDAYVKEVDELLSDFSTKISAFNEALKSWKELCVEKEMAKHEKVSLVDCIINLSEACSFQLRSRPIADGYGLEEISWPRLEKRTADDDPGGRRESILASVLAKSAGGQQEQQHLDLDEGEEAARDVVVHYQRRVSPTAAALQAATFRKEERLKKLIDCMTISLKQQMELASDNGERWTIDVKRKRQNRNSDAVIKNSANNNNGAMTEMGKLKLRNRKNCKVVAETLKLMLFTREKLADINTKLKVALV